MWGNQGGFGDQGGGYMTSPAPGFGSPQMSQEGRKSRQMAQNLIPCTVAQLLNAEHVQQDDKFVIDSIELRQVTVVGVVRSVKETATRVDYEIDDSTGPFLEVKQFVDNDEGTQETERTPVMRESTYVRAFGNLRSFNGKRSVTAFKVVPITDMNEVTTHLLEVTYAHLALTRKQAGGGGSVAAAGAGTNTSTYSGAQDNAAMQTGANLVNGLNNVQQQVQLVIQGCQDEQGVSVQQICERLRSFQPAAIRDALEFLSGEGHVYSTIDDDHYRSTDSM